MYAVFDESLVTGNEMIDSQHKELISKINDLVKSCETSTGMVTAVKTLDYLSEYTDFHFSAERSFRKRSAILSWKNIRLSTRICAR